MIFYDSYRTPDPAPTEMHYHFTEPYFPQGDEFKPVPLQTKVEFAEICTGPPWSTGDIESTRRKSAGDDPQNSAFTQRAIRCTESFVRSSGPGNYSQQSPTLNSIGWVDAILSLLEPSPEAFECSTSFTNLVINSQEVPFHYVRDKIPSVYRNLFLNGTNTTHTLHLTSVLQEKASMPIHDIVMITQCFEFLRIVGTERRRRNQRKRRPSLYVEGVPDLNSFGVLLKWLYTNDEEELFRMLSEARPWDLIYGFAQNCKFWGVVDERISKVIQAVFGAMGVYEFDILGAFTEHSNVK